jgi:hypothetical protein
MTAIATADPTARIRRQEDLHEKYNQKKSLGLNAICAFH